MTEITNPKLRAKSKRQNRLLQKATLSLPLGMKMTNQKDQNKP